MDDDLRDVRVDSIANERPRIGTAIHRRFEIPADIDLKGIETMMCSMCEELAEYKLSCKHQLCKNCFSTSYVCPKHEGGAAIDRSKSYRLDCTREPVPCPNKDNGCRCEVRLDELKIHLEYCLYRMVPCGRCRKKVQSSELENHLATGCGWLGHECPFCSIIMPYSDLSNHLDRCHRKTDDICYGLTEMNFKTFMCLKECFRRFFPRSVPYISRCCQVSAWITVIIFLCIFVLLVSS